MNDFEIKNNENTENTNNAQKPPKHTVRKTVSLLMAMAIVSAGSIGIYRVGTNYSSSSADGSSSSQAQQSSEISTSVSAEQMSLINSGSSSESLTTEEVVNKVLPSVVGIESNFTYTSSGSGNGYYYGYGFGNNSNQESTATATGTGVVITADGYIMTNAHVIYDSEYNAGLADSISVLLSDDTSYDAEVVGYDTDCDIAVLKIDAENLIAAEFGNSDELNLGESVVAIGNPLGFELMDTVTSGIISGLNREITINDKSMNLIQTDAAINSGNSGGPLINKYGQVIGINSSKMSSSYSETTIEGIGFAIPINEASAIVDDLMEYGYVTGKPQLGISCQDVSESISQMYNIPIGAYVTAVNDGSSAANAGIQVGDVITAVNGTEITTTEELNTEKNKHSSGDTITLTLNRNGSSIDVEAVLDEANVSN